MRTCDYTTHILPAVLALANSDTTNATDADKAKIAALAQRRGREAWQFAFWPETMELEERTIEQAADRCFVPLDQASELAIGLVRECWADDPLRTRNAARVRWVLDGERIYFPDYSYTTVWVSYQRTPPADVTASNALPLRLRDGIAQSLYSDFLRPAAGTDNVPFEATAGFAFLQTEALTLARMQKQARPYTQN